MKKTLTNTPLSSNFNKKINCSVDTNILIAIYNSEDRLNKDALELMRRVSNLYIGESVINEVSKTFSKKILEIFSDIIYFYKDLDLNTLNDEDIIKMEDELLKNLNSKNPKNINFHRYIIKKSREIRKKYRNNKDIIFELFRLYKEINDESCLLRTILNNIYSINNKINFHIYRFTYKDHKKIEEYLKTIEDIKFKDDNDKKILIELILCYPNQFELPIIFVSDDKEFIKKSKKAIEKLKSKYGEEYYKNLKIIKLSELIKK